MKNAQSQGNSGFARVLTMLVLLLAMATGAWADDWTNIIVNSDMEGTDVSCFYVHEQAGGMYLARITDGIGKDGSRAIKLQSSDNETNSWDTQFNMRLPYVLPAGTQYKLSFDYKSDQIAVQEGDNDGTFGFQISNEPGHYVWWTLSGWPPPSLSVSESDVNKWLHFEETYTVPAELNGTTQSDQGDWLLAFRTIYVNLSGNKVATEVIFDNVKVEILNSVLNTLTPEPATDPTLMIPYYNDDDVAVGKLEAAIEAYGAIASPTADDKATLKAAIGQFNADNADQVKDETAKVGTAVESWVNVQNGKDFKIYPHNGINLVQVFGVSRKGDVINQTVTAHNTGTYDIELYATSHNAWEGQYMDVAGDNPAPTLQGESNDVAYVFGSSGGNTVKTKITARRGSGLNGNEPETYAVNGVNVTDGKLTFGIALADLGKTEWHTIQIKSLKWNATAKEVFAADQAELQAALTEARTLLADENKIEGKNDFNTAIANAEPAVDSKMINITELEAVIATLKTAIADFKKANRFIDFSAVQYYIIDAEGSGKMMAAGHEWGTRAIVNELGLDLTLTPNSETHTVTIDSRVFNGDTKHFLGSNLYMDSDSYGWAFEYQGFGFYILDPASEKYLNIDANDNLVLSDTPREWIIVTAEGVMEQLLADMANATEENPVDATRLIKANSFNRNDARNAEAWTVEQTLTGQGHTTNLSGGENENDGSVGNNCAEAYCTPFSFTQTITGAPAGVYQLTAQGFYVEEEGEDDAPTFFANDAKGAIPARTGSEGDMKSAAISFKAGNYTNDPIEFQVKDNGQIVLGVSGTSERQWVIFDNFRLTYLGKPAPVVTTQKVSLAEDTEDADNWKVKAGDATEFGDLPVEGVPEGTTVTLKYNGTREVKSIKVKVTK